jgi:hypothetical protein
MNVSRYLAESFLGESIEHKLTPEIRKELESFGFRELNDGSYMLNPSKKMTDVVTVEKEGTGILVRWSVGSKHDYKEITTKEVGPFVKSIISKFGGSKIPGKIQEVFESKNTIISFKSKTTGKVNFDDETFNVKEGDSIEIEVGDNSIHNETDWILSVNGKEVCSGSTPTKIFNDEVKTLKNEKQLKESRIEDFTEEDVEYFNSIGAKKVGNGFVKVIDDLKLIFTHSYSENRHILLTLKSISRDGDARLFKIILS